MRFNQSSESLQMITKKKKKKKKHFPGDEWFSQLQDSLHIRMIQPIKRDLIKTMTQTTATKLTYKMHMYLHKTNILTQSKTTWSYREHNETPKLPLSTPDQRFSRIPSVFVRSNALWEEHSVSGLRVMNKRVTS